MQLYVYIFISIHVHIYRCTPPHMHAHTDQQTYSHTYIDVYTIFGVQQLDYIVRFLRFCNFCLVPSIYFVCCDTDDWRELVSWCSREMILQLASVVEVRRECRCIWWFVEDMLLLPKNFRYSLLAPALEIKKVKKNTLYESCVMWPFWYCWRSA